VALVAAEIGTRAGVMCDTVGAGMIR